MDPAQAKGQAEALVRAAESLVAKAKAEATSIVNDGQTRVAGIVADADALRQAAEREAEGLKAEAEHVLITARRQADVMLAEAAAARDAAVESARAELDDVAVTNRAESPGDPDRAVEQASEVADRILRVARSEAEARGKAITEEARRKAELVERDARARVDMAAREHRELVRSMQQSELAAKARIRALDTEVARLERLLGRVTADAEGQGVDTSPSADPAEPREVTASGIVFPATVSAQSARVPGRDPEKASPPLVERPRPLERIAATQPVRSEDLDAEKARRAIRRRA
ncbi:MAG TPA: hypothetical protein VMS74_15305 [Acidimicrobiia bacterium]|nr:hypothetical protein [Acidimicrobiia bacterium]